MFVVVSCKSCGDTSTRGDWEEGCPMCGADETYIIIQGHIDPPKEDEASTQADRQNET